MGCFESWDEFGVFQRTVERSTRYVLSDRSKRFIGELIDTSEKRKRVIEQRVVWRAQLDYRFKTFYQRRFHLEGEALVYDDDLEPVGEVPTALWCPVNDPLAGSGPGGTDKPEGDSLPVRG